jgi:uncharacterized integral membrane protein
MRQKRQWTVSLGAALCGVLSLLGGTVPPFNTQSLPMIFAYELSMIAGMLLILLLVYKRGFTE